MKVGVSQRDSLVGVLFALLATVIWSGNFIVARELYETVPPLSLAFYRWLVAVLVILPFAFQTILKQFSVIRQHVAYLLITATLGVSLFNTLLYFASHTSSALNLSLISITFPIFIIIASRIFYKETLNLKTLLGVVLVIIGVLYLITKGDVFNLLHIAFSLGDILTLFSALTFAGYSLMLKRKPKELSIMALQATTFFLGLVLLTPFFIWQETQYSVHYIDTRFIGLVLYLGIFASIIAFLFWNKAIALIGPTKTALIYYTLPVFSGIGAYIVLNEAIGSVHFFSAILIVLGIFIANKSMKR